MCWARGCPWERRPDLLSGGRCRELNWREGTTEVATVPVPGWTLRPPQLLGRPGPLPCRRRPCAVGPVDAPLPPFTFSLASLQLPAPPTTFLFSVLRASALLLRAPPLPSGQVPLPSGHGGPGMGCLLAHPACRCPGGGGRAGGQAGLLHLRTPSGLALPRCCHPSTRSPMAPPQLLGHRPRCSLRALPLVAAGSQAASGEQTRGPTQRCRRGGGA